MYFSTLSLSGEMSNTSTQLFWLNFRSLVLLRPFLADVWHRLAPAEPVPGFISPQDCSQPPQLPMKHCIRYLHTTLPSYPTTQDLGWIFSVRSVQRCERLWPRGVLLAPSCRHNRYWLDTWGPDCTPKSVSLWASWWCPPCLHRREEPESQLVVVFSLESTTESGVNHHQAAGRDAALTCGQQHLWQQTASSARNHLWFTLKGKKK